MCKQNDAPFCLVLYHFYHNFTYHVNREQHLASRLIVHQNDSMTAKQNGTYTSLHDSDVSFLITALRSENLLDEEGEITLKQHFGLGVN